MTRHRRLKAWSWVAALALLALLAWTATGPWRTLAAIRHAVAAGDARALSRHVDFPALRASLKPQIQDRVVRAAGADAQPGRFAAFGVAVASGVAGGLVDSMVTPAGLGAMMEGRKVWNRLGGAWPPSGGNRGDPPVSPPDPRLRFESFSHASATVAMDDGGELVLVLSRKGTRWRLSEIRLPPA